MSRFVIRFAMPLIACCALLPAVAGAQSPFSKLSLFKHLEADPNKEYKIVESNGPWLILCSTFLGEDGKNQAKQLVLELRREFKLNAYLHEMEWDFSGKVPGRGVDKYGKPKQMEHANYEKREEYAVLVGDFPTVDDEGAQATLEKIRYLKPQCLDPEYITKSGQKNARAFAGWRMASAQLLSKDEEMKRRGPMGKAFLVTNPLIPQEYFRPKGLDPLVERMNEPVQHSLLKCPGKYTVKVATFGGAMISLQKDIDAVEQGRKKLTSKLEQAAINAHLLTEALRAKGYDAYEFHDHGASLVTVGSFDSVGTPRSDGKIEINPEVHKIMQTFGPSQKVGPDGKSNYVPGGLAGIPFDVQPLLIEVPKRTISATYDRSSLSAR